MWQPAFGTVTDTLPSQLIIPFASIVPFVLHVLHVSWQLLCHKLCPLNAIHTLHNAVKVSTENVPLVATIVSMKREPNQGLPSDQHMSGLLMSLAIIWRHQSTYWCILHHL